MNKRILLLAAVAVGFSSCSTLYKSGQTPDDVYYSPAPQQRVAYANHNNSDEYYDDNSGNEYVNVQTEQDRSAYRGEDNYLRMKVRNRALWSSLDDYAYYGGGMMYSPYLYGGRFGMGMGYNPYSFYSPYSYFGMNMGYGWGGLYNGFYNPYSFYSPYSFYDPYYSYGYGHYYYPGSISLKPGNVRPAGTYSPRTSNLRSYGNRSSNPELNNSRNAPVRVFRNGNNNYVNPRNASPGDTRPRRSVDRSSDSRPSRTFDRDNSAPSSSPRVAPSSNSGSRSSGGGGSTPSRAPGRGGR